MKTLNQNRTRRIRRMLTIINLLSLASSSSGTMMVNNALRIHRSSLINVVTDSISSSSSLIGAFISSPTMDTSKKNIYTKTTSSPFHNHNQRQHPKVQLQQSSPQHTDASSTGYARPLVNWYPGHIAKAERLLSETLKSVDVIIEVRDARAPKATAHPRVAEWTAGRPRVVVLTHVDMVPKKSFNMWKASYDTWGAGKWDGMVDKQVRNQALQNLQEREKYVEEGEGGANTKSQRQESTSSSSTSSSLERSNVDFTSRVEDVLFLDAKRGTGIHALHRAIYKAGSHVNERRLRRGLNERPLRVGVIGYPNVGKSALINKILGRKRARSANTPGITRSLQWIRVRTDINSSSKNSGKSKREFELLDSPGIIPSHMIDQSDAFLLAACNSIGDAAYDNQIIAGYLCEWVKTLHVMGKGDATAPQWRNKCLQRYGFDPLEPYNYSVYPTNRSITSFNNNDKTMNKPLVEKRIMSGEDMLYRVADECCKGDVENAARKILQDYRSGRWGPVSLQLAPESEDDEGQAKVSIMSSILNDGMTTREEEERLRIEMEEREKRAKVAMEMAKERGLELPPIVEKKHEDKEEGEEKEMAKDGEKSSSSSCVPDGEVGKGLFDGW